MVLLLGGGEGKQALEQEMRDLSECNDPGQARMTEWTGRYVFNDFVTESGISHRDSFSS